jgi:hypothetical protein
MPRPPIAGVREDVSIVMVKKRLRELLSGEALLDEIRGCITALRNFQLHFGSRRA